ncbi:hypothetical protein N1851_006203 [Merluccius polli]|uniref:Uncharacterized protein n=1 Tax=Merluccius polli TaxID=89951 RepID=A0AA47P9L8_MERPO|nr:hypothetical protein N1851_006203 [Merluccius polli]
MASDNTASDNTTSDNTASDNTASDNTASANRQPFNFRYCYYGRGKSHAAVPVEVARQERVHVALAAAVADLVPDVEGGALLETVQQQPGVPARVAWQGWWRGREPARPRARKPDPSPDLGLAKSVEH